MVSDQCQGMKDLYEKKDVKTQKHGASVADGIIVKTPSPVMHESYISRLIDDIVSVTDTEIIEAMVLLLERQKVVTEGAGAAVLAGALKASWDLGRQTVLLLGGGNVDPHLLSRVIQKDLFRKKSIVELRLVIYDKPGALNDITQTMREHNINILQVVHDHMAYHLGGKEVEVDFLIEILGEDHFETLKKALNQKRGLRILS